MLLVSSPLGAAKNEETSRLSYTSVIGGCFDLRKLTVFATLCFGGMLRQEMNVVHYDVPLQQAQSLVVDTTLEEFLR